MSKLSDLLIETEKLRGGRGIRPWNDTNVIRPEGGSPSTSNEQRDRMPLENVSIDNIVNKYTNGVSTVPSFPAAHCQENSEELEVHHQIEKEDIIKPIVGNEKKILQLIWEKCQIGGSSESPVITTDELATVLKVSSVRIRNLVYRLSNKNLIEVSKVKNGRNGWRIFKLSEKALRVLDVSQNAI